MPRTARLDIPVLLQHVIVRGIEKRDIFLTDFRYPSDHSEIITATMINFNNQGEK